MVGFPGGSVVKNLAASAETQVQSLIQEDPTCHGAAKPRGRNYKPVLWSLGTATAEPACHNC